MELDSFTIHRKHAWMRLLCNSIRIDPVISTTISQSHTTLWGLYATNPLTTKSTAAKFNNIALDLFYLGFYHGNARFNDGVANETRHTLGGRLWRAHHINGLDFNIFGVYQFGLLATKKSARSLRRSIWVISFKNCVGASSRR
jgi:hypothetical protein